MILNSVLTLSFNLWLSQIANLRKYDIDDIVWKTRKI